jgi:two-component system sensor histidine kinase/response regulator
VNGQISGGISKRQRVLIVDDALANRELLRSLLEHEVDLEEAADGTTALRLCEENDFDLVLLDVMMPDLSGYEVCRRLRASRGSEHLPILLLTSLTEQTERIHGFDAGADDFITKPINTVELRLRVRAFLRTRRLYRERQSLLDDLQRMHDLKDDLATLLVHDLRNPLTGLVAHLDLIETDVLSVDDRESLDAARVATQHLREMIDDLLQVRILEEGALEVVCTPHSIDGIVGDAIATMDGVARGRGISLVQRYAGECMVECERSLLRRATENLLANAIRHGPSGSVVTIRAEASSSTVDVSVEDEGAGIPEAQRPLLFSKYGTTELRRGGRRSGHGLGLYLVSLVMHAHGGGVKVEESQRRGTRVVMELPRALFEPS